MTQPLESSPEHPQPSFKHALITLSSILLTISVGLYFGISLHILLLICLVIASVSAALQGHSYPSIRQAMNSGISGALQAIYIFILIGVLIAAFIESGTLATLIYYGIEFVRPAWFLPAGLLLCSFMSIATGTSWGTVGTAGVVLMGIGSAMGIPEPIIAGMVISGACFGDKMSPMSDTTNLAAMTSRTDLYSHIQSMLFTTGPSYILTLVIFGLVGIEFAGNELPAEKLFALQSALSDTFSISLLALLPLVVMLGMSISRIAAEPSMMAAVSCRR